MTSMVISRWRGQGLTRQGPYCPFNELPDSFDLLQTVGSGMPPDHLFCHRTSSASDLLRFHARGVRARQSADNDPRNEMRGFPPAAHHHHDHERPHPTLYTAFFMALASLLKSHLCVCSPVRPLTVNKSRNPPCAIAAFSLTVRPRLKPSVCSS